MTAHAYLVWRSFINNVKETLHKPGKLILYIIVIAAMVGVIIISIFVRREVEETARLFWFTGVLFLYISIFVISSILNGLSGGNTIFEMNDVNLMFTAPLSSRKTLLYGVVRMAKTAFLASFFVLFQSGTLANFGVGFDGVMLTFCAFLLSVMVLTIGSILIYSVTNSNPRRKTVVKAAAVLMFVPLVSFLAYSYFTTGDITSAIEAAVNSPFLRYIPVSGWTSGAVTAILTGETAYGVFMFALTIALGIGLVTYILLTNPDYYEDVLVATETAYEKKRALESGDINAAQQSKRQIKVAKTGIPFSGAAALFGKHIRETLRKNRFGFFPLMSVCIVSGAVIAAFFIRDLMIVLQVLMWAQMFLIGTGLGIKETYSHYIFMIPESSFKKILWSNMEIMTRIVLENALIFGIGGLIAGSGIVYILLCFAVYTLFSFLLLGINYLSMRYLGADLSAGLLIMIYVGVVLLFMAPGLIAAIVVGVFVGGSAGVLTGLLILAAWELLAGLICFALSKGVLHDCDMSVIKTS